MTYWPLAGWPGKGGGIRTVAVSTDGLIGPSFMGKGRDYLEAQQVDRRGRRSGRKVRIAYGRILNRKPAALNAAGKLVAVTS